MWQACGCSTEKTLQVLGELNEELVAVSTQADRFFVFFLESQMIIVLVSAWTHSAVVVFVPQAGLPGTDADELVAKVQKRSPRESQL